MAKKLTTSDLQKKLNTLSLSEILTMLNLQQGHINPNKELSLDNTIPQCEYCNQNIYKDDFVFTRDGYPNKINNPKYVLRSDKSVRKEMLEILKKDQNNGNKPD